MFKNNLNNIYFIIATLIIILLISGIIITLSNSKQIDTNQAKTNSDMSDKKSNSANKMTVKDHSLMHMGMGDMVVDDKTFLENMVPHHQEAVDSSKIVLANSQDTDIKTFAQGVVNVQTKEISEMKNWYNQKFNAEYSINKSYIPMMTGMNNKTGTELDKEYIKGMIDHHQGAVEMAKKIQTVSNDAQILNLANNIINSQSTEISLLENWLTVKFGV